MSDSVSQTIAFSSGFHAPSASDTTLLAVMIRSIDRASRLCLRIPMTTIGMHYDVIPGKETEFKKGFLAVLDLCKTLPGHVASSMYENIQAKGSYVILSEWETKEAFEKFIHSDEFAAAVAWGKAEILRGRPRHKVYSS